ncbi:hypothetical protein E5Q_05157 [Mixia osmundae IAM 14324]|uniref:NmrA-like domain-containing protein n=1 Tax=Mixia osmundae (strain CBS 9802 / IAM 14324 / JCM 22182 / KY 12970) TaxID=764103 RepID=G7E6L1_MIXOS|nr:hypothetical protein E5Q_05157 [Mixia osmundae IAM 14324]
MLPRTHQAHSQQGSTIIESIIRDDQLSRQFSIRAVMSDPEEPAAAELEAKGIEVYAGSLDDVESVTAAVEGAFSVVGMVPIADDRLQATKMSKQPSRQCRYRQSQQSRQPPQSSRAPIEARAWRAALVCYHSPRDSQPAFAGSHIAARSISSRERRIRSVGLDGHYERVRQLAVHPGSSLSSTTIATARCLVMNAIYETLQ